MTGDLSITNHVDFGLGHDNEPRFPAVSSKLPVWTGWSKGISNDKWDDTTREKFYIVREDGEMFYFVAKPMSMEATYMGAFEGFVDQGFACCEVDTSLQNPYYMVSAGVMSPGEVKQIGKTGEDTYAGERSEALRAYTVDRIENWSPSKDLILSDLSDSVQPGRSRNRTSIFMTAGRGPEHGAIVKIKKGLAAHVNTHFAVEESARTTALWMLDDGFDSIFLIASLPEATSVFHLPCDYGEVTELMDGDGCDMKLDRPTLLASIISFGQLLQVTSSEVIVLRSDGPILTETALLGSNITSDCAIVGAAVDSGRNYLVLALRNLSGFAIRAVAIRKLLVKSGTADANVEAGELMRLPAEPTSLVLFTCHGISYAAASNAGGHLQVFRLDGGLGLHLILDYKFSGATGGTAESPNICGSLAYLHGEWTPKAAFSLACGMRDGSVVILDLIPGNLTDESSAMTDRNANNIHNTLQIRNTNIQRLGTTPASLSVDGARSPQNVYATCGADVIRIQVHDGSGAISYDEVVFTPEIHPPDRSQPIRGLSPIISMTEDRHRLAMVSGDTMVIAHLDHHVSTVPLSLGLKNSTPEHVIYCERLSAFIVASTRIKLQRPLVPLSRWRGKRTTYAQIDIVSVAHPLDDDGKPLRLGKFKLWPGERINAMLDWKFKDAKGRKHAQLVVATALPQQSSSSMKGRLLFLSLKRDEDGNGIDIIPTKDSLFEDSVRSIAAYSDRILVVATGLKVQLMRLIVEAAGARWIRVCRKELRSPAVHITAEAPFIHVSTTDDSLVVFRLTMLDSGANILDEDDRDNDLDAVSRAATPEQTLETVFTDSEARDVIHHLPLQLRVPRAAGTDQTDAMELDVNDEVQQRTNLMLIADRYCNITGLFIPPQPTQGTAAPTLFEVQLPRSVMRIAQGPVRPPWRQTAANTLGSRSILADDLLGASIDGAMYQFSIVDETAWRVLKVLETAAKLQDMVRSEAAGRYIPEEEWERTTRFPSGTDLLDKANFHVNGDLLGRHIASCEDLEGLLRTTMQHSRYRGPDAEVFAGDVRGLLDLRNDCGADELIERLHAWYMRIVMPML